MDPVSPIFIDSAVQAGVVFTDDFNDPNNRQGVGYYHFNIRGGIRESAARAMLAPVLGQRSNLRLELGATVKRVLFDDKVHVWLQYPEGWVFFLFSQLWYVAVPFASRTRVQQQRSAWSMSKVTSAPHTR